jgi:hypothetical protein
MPRTSFMRARVRRLLTTPATIERTGAVLPMYVEPDTGETASGGAPRSQRSRRWRLVFEVGVDVQVNDRIMAATGTYVVVQAEDPRTIQVQTEMLAYLTRDAHGNLTYLIPNATVTRKRGSDVSGPLRVRLRYPTFDETIMAGGGVLPTHAEADPAQDWKSNDHLEIVGVDLDGRSVVPEVHGYHVALVTRVPDPMGYLDLQLAGGPT